MSPETYSVFDDRETEEYLAHSHNERTETLGDWKDRIEDARALTRGEISYTNPDGVVVSGDLQITNLADQMPRDTARLVSEVEPTYRAPIRGNTDKDDLKAEVRGAIARGYFEVNRFDLIRPFLSMDLDLAGACFVAAWVDPKTYVPRFERIDPFFAYPDTYNGKLIDLLVVQQMKLRTARMVFPGINFSDLYARMSENDDITIMDYYGPKFNTKAIGRSGDQGGNINANDVHVIGPKVFHQCDRPTVGFAMLPSPTGEFHGSLDQIGKPMSTKNRLVNLITEYSHEAIYAPWEERGILNWQEDPGPNTKYHHNTSLDGETFMRRMPPAPFNGDLFGLLQFLETEQRGQLGYPVTRSGEVSQSQGSASFVAATQGQLTSIVRERQRLLSMVQEDLAYFAYKLDQHILLDFEKPLPHVIGDKKTYVPSKDIGEEYHVRVEYGAGAGLDRINADQRLINFNTIGALSKESVLEQTDFISDPRGEMEKIENEEMSRILLEKFLSDPAVTADIIGLVVSAKKKRGISLSEAWSEVQAELMAQQEEAAQAQAAAGVPAEAAPGAVPGAPTEAAPQPTPEFAQTPMHQVISG